VHARPVGEIGATEQVLITNEIDGLK